MFQDYVSSICTNLVRKKYGKNYKGECLVDSDGCFMCGKLGKNLRECPMGSQKGRYAYQQRHSYSLVAPVGWLTQQGALSSATNGQRHKRFYVFPSRQDQEGSPDVVMGTLQVFHIYVYQLLNLGAMIPSVTPHITVDFCFIPKILL